MARSRTEHGVKQGGGWRAWLGVVALALLLLLLSEALWLWQTWPVRELLQWPAPGGLPR